MSAPLASSSLVPDSPPVPAVAAKLKAKRRTMTLVNPADPDDFSTDSISSGNSNHSIERRAREVTPVSTALVQQYTPLGVAEYGVKGILRSAGTPGSGNGVRFYPKNRFRVITPREELGGPSTPQKKPPPPPAATSFFSQLLSVVPVMSPRRAPPAEIVHEVGPDESWETPGEEGEISLVASSVHSCERSTILEEDEEGEGEGQSLEVPWTGPAEVHSSPLFIPMEGSSRDISIQDIGTSHSLQLSGPEISMDDWKLRLNAQEDVSNLLSTSLPEYGEGSFSISSMAGPSFLPPRPVSLSPPGSANREDTGGSSWTQGEQSSLLSVNEDDNPTIRRRLSPVPSPGQASTSGKISPNTSSSARILSPLPTRSPKPKPFTSIFADMSAEQAELSWPLIRPSIPSSNLKTTSKPDETAFHSFADSPLPPRQTPIPATSITAKSASTTPRTIGNETEFFDATASFFPLTPCPNKPAPGTSLRPTSYSGPLGQHTGLSALASPTKAMFEAHQGHTIAIQAELETYRRLAQQLGKEVEERDKVLAEMSLRLVESEMKATSLSTSEVDKSHMQSSRRESLSLSPSPSPLAAKSATAKTDERAIKAEAEVRDLEIRLEKALSEQRSLAQEVSAVKQSHQETQQEKVDLAARLEKREERDRETAITDKHLQYQLQEAEKEMTRLRGTQVDVHQIQDELLEMKRLRRADEEEMDRLNGLLDRQKEGVKRKEEQYRQALLDVQAEMEDLRRAKEELERELSQERRSTEDLEVMVRELKLALHQSQTDLTQSTTHQSQTTSRLKADLTRLRAEISDKDLEILNLQRRKSELKEDREMLNVALDSKQQEVELLKRKLSRSTATPLPLGTSQRQNLTPLPTAQTPAPMTGASLKLHPNTAVHSIATQTQKRMSSASYATPLASNGRTMRSGAVLMGSTAVRDRVMRKVSGQREIGEGKQERRMSKRESVLA